MNTTRCPVDARILARLPPTPVFLDDLEAVGYLTGATGRGVDIAVMPFTRSNGVEGTVARSFNTGRQYLKGILRL